jgi:hypothetical protein
MQIYQKIFLLKRINVIYPAASLLFTLLENNAKTSPRPPKSIYKAHYVRIPQCANKYFLKNWELGGNLDRLKSSCFMPG